MKNSLDLATQSLEAYYQSKEGITEEKEIELVKTYFNWIDKKTKLIKNEKSFSIPSDVTIKRGDVFWIEFGYNVDEELGGRHPGIVLRKGGNTAIVIPVSTQEPTQAQIDSGIYVEIPRIYEFKTMRRWVNILNTIPVSIQRFDFDAKKGNVKGFVLDTINAAVYQAGLWNRV